MTYTKQNALAHQKLMKRLRKMTPHELFLSCVDVGIYTSDGDLTPQYGGKKMWFVYIVRCGDGSLYTGITTDVAKRVKAHQDGKGAKYTRGRGPITLCDSRKMPSKSSALRLESFIKRQKKDDKLTALHSNVDMCDNDDK